MNKCSMKKEIPPPCIGMHVSTHIPNEMCNNSTHEKFLGQTIIEPNRWTNERTGRNTNTKIECQNVRNENNIRKIRAQKKKKKVAGTLQNLKYVNLQLMLKWNNHVYLAVCVHCAFHSPHIHADRQTHTHTYSVPIQFVESARASVELQLQKSINTYESIKSDLHMLEFSSKQNRNSTTHRHHVAHSTPPIAGG